MPQWKPRQFLPVPGKGEIMLRFTLMAVGVVGAASVFAVAEDRSWDELRTVRQAKYRTQAKPAELIARTYNVADLVIPQGKSAVPQAAEESRAAKPHFDDLISFIRRETSSKSWERDGASIGHYEATLSLVIRQTPDVHEQIADKLGQLRRTQDVQVVCQLTVVAGPRRLIADLASRFPGELGRQEAEELQQALKDSDELRVISRPQVCTLNSGTALIQIDEQTTRVAIPVQQTVAEDRRSIRVKMSVMRGGDAADVLAKTQTLELYDGRTAAVHFEADRAIPGLPPADDAEELIITVTPRVIIQEEEEELLGIPTE